MKNKNMLIGLGIAGAVALLLGGLIVYNLLRKPATTNENTASQSAGDADACTIFTQDKATTLLGAGPVKLENMVPSASNDLSVSTCTYSAANDGTLESIKNIRTATILVRAPKNETGIVSNKAVFDAPAAGSQTVTGYGDAAFWNPEMGQLNVLKKNTWMILSYGKSAIADRTLEETKKLADLIIPGY